MITPERRILTALAASDGLTVLELCTACCLWAADVVETLERLAARGLVERVGEVWRIIPPGRAASVDSVIDAHVAQLKKEE